MTPQNVKICFIDTETTSLAPDREAWDIAIIIREPGKPDVEHQWFADINLAKADPFALKIGGFYDRHPEGRWLSGQVGIEHEPEVGRGFKSPLASAAAIARHTYGAHLIGANPMFDVFTFEHDLRAHRLTPAWHYHVVNIEDLILGWLEGRGKYQLRWPWKSDMLFQAIGIDPGDYDRHSALGDACLVRDAFDKVFPSDDT